MPRPEQLEKIREHVIETEANIKTWEHEIELAERAGVDVPDQRERLKEAKARLRKIKAAYEV